MFSKSGDNESIPFELSLKVGVMHVYVHVYYFAVCMGICSSQLLLLVGCL